MQIGKQKMQEIYDIVKTPYKYGAVIKIDDCLTDCPAVFKYKDKWYMYYIMMSKNVEDSGYETHYASSDNLLDWKYEGKILERNQDGKWDSKQIAGYVTFPDINFGGSYEHQKVNGKYYMSYMGGKLDGYETDPLMMGLSFSDSPIGKFTRFENPVLSPGDADAHEGAKLTLYKRYMFEDKELHTGHKYVNFYNAKGMNHKERIYLAVSDDGEHWQRYEKNPVIDETEMFENHRITGDAQVVKIGDVYVMFYFRFTEGVGAYNNFACSKDLIDWTLWDGEPLVKSEYEWENEYAHKSWVVKHEGIVYHYYCATNDKGERFIALATSEKI